MNKSTPHIYLSELLDLWIDKGLKPGELSNGTVGHYISVSKRISNILNQAFCFAV